MEQQGQPLLTARQLLHAFCCRSALTAGKLLSGRHGPMLPPKGRALVQLYADQACDRALALEPESPSICLEVARHAAPPYCGHAYAVPFTACALYCSMYCRYMAEDTGGSGSSRQAAQQRIVDLYLKAVRLGQEQRRDFWIARCAPPALIHVAVSTGVSRASSEAAVAAFHLAKPALKRCKPLMPERWARAVEGLLTQADAILPLVEARLRLLQAGGDSSAVRATLEATAQALLAAHVATLPTAIPHATSAAMAAARGRLACAAAGAAGRRSTAGEWHWGLLAAGGAAMARRGHMKRNPHDSITPDDCSASLTVTLNFLLSALPLQPRMPEGTLAHSSQARVQAHKLRGDSR